LAINNLHVINQWYYDPAVLTGIQDEHDGGIDGGDVWV
jgi:hypothetical protein